MLNEELVGEALSPIRDQVVIAIKFGFNVDPGFDPRGMKGAPGLNGQPGVDLLARIGKEKGATHAQVALAWLLAQKPWISPIPGTTKLHRLDENIGAADVELTVNDLREIETAAAKIEVLGARYPERLEKMTGL